MLSELIIENVAVIEKADINFKEGFTCLTGETGAGKSIIIDSINAIMGDRVSKNIVRTGASKASVVAVFNNLEQSIIDKAAELDIDISEECIVTRQITADGKSTARINSVPYPVGVLKTLFTDAINIHGQHDNQKLLIPSKHIEILDSFGTDSAIKATYSRLYRQYKDINRQICEIEETEKNKKETVDLLSYQIDEIEKAGISIEEEENLLQEKQIAKNAETILTNANRAHNYIFGDDESFGAVSELQEAAGNLLNISSFSPELKAISDKLSEAYAISQDAGYDLKSFIDSFDVDVSRIDEIEQRLDLYYKLKMKYGSTVEDILNFYNESKEKLEKMEFARENLSKLYRERQVVLDKLTISADRLSNNRREVFAQMAEEIKNSLEFLNMPFVTLALSMEKKDFAPDGQDNIEFLISANKGEMPKPLSKIASGGELSRIMLAIKNVLAEKEDTHTLIFDEIDTGVSGSAAMKIGRLLKETSVGKQVLCVTHSAQIAAFADNHLQIEKKTDESATFTSVRELHGDERDREIARIISGENITETSLMNAKEMILNAKNI